MITGVQSLLDMSKGKEQGYLPNILAAATLIKQQRRVQNGTEPTVRWGTSIPFCRWGSPARPTQPSPAFL